MNKVITIDIFILFNNNSSSFIFYYTLDRSVKKPTLVSAYRFLATEKKEGLKLENQIYRSTKNYCSSSQKINRRKEKTYSYRIPFFFGCAYDLNHLKNLRENF